MLFWLSIDCNTRGKLAIDAALVSPSKGLVLFDLVEGTDVGQYQSRQDDIANKIEARLKLHRELVNGRRLSIDIAVITFAPGIPHTHRIANSDYPVCNSDNLLSVIQSVNWSQANEQTYRTALSAIENISSIRKPRTRREVNNPQSRGSQLKKLEEQIATLDYSQNRAVIETVDGVQRIRGLAGSGKTIVLALKAAYLHSQHREWRIAVTFHTRSLKGQFKRLIYDFCIQQTGEGPDWNYIRVVNAWGAPGGDDRDGIYFEFCRATGSEFLDFRAASSQFSSSDHAFDGACRKALDEASKTVQLYDVILVDEAQDFSPSFLRLCYAILSPLKRLVYAYDELQNLSGESLPSPAHIFGLDEHAKPLVNLGEDDRRDVILERCYRNSRPVLVSAHALGFGIYRDPPPHAETGLVQMFDHPRLWEEIGYCVRDGELVEGKHVVLERTDKTSPLFLEQVSSTVEDLVQFISFENESQQTEWIVNELRRNLETDELCHDDIVVIHPDPPTAREKPE